jgi:hypothetical protein
MVEALVEKWIRKTREAVEESKRLELVKQAFVSEFGIEPNVSFNRIGQAQAYYIHEFSEPIEIEGQQFGSIVFWVTELTFKKDKEEQTEETNFKFIKSYSWYAWIKENKQYKFEVVLNFYREEDE